jgi:hypothetical protein
MKKNILKRGIASLEGGLVFSGLHGSEILRGCCDRDSRVVIPPSTKL